MFGEWLIVVLDGVEIDRLFTGGDAGEDDVADRVDAVVGTCLLGREGRVPHPLGDLGGDETLDGSGGYSASLLGGGGGGGERGRGSCSFFRSLVCRILSAFLCRLA